MKVSSVEASTRGGTGPTSPTPGTYSRYDCFAREHNFTFQTFQEISNRLQQQNKELSELKNKINETAKENYVFVMF